MTWQSTRNNFGLAGLALWLLVFACKIEGADALAVDAEQYQRKIAAEVDNQQCEGGDKKKIDELESDIIDLEDDIRDLEEDIIDISDRIENNRSINPDKRNASIQQLNANQVQLAELNIKKQQIEGDLTTPTTIIQKIGLFLTDDNITDQEQLKLIEGRIEEEESRQLHNQIETQRLTDELAAQTNLIEQRAELTAELTQAKKKQAELMTELTQLLLKTIGELMISNKEDVTIRNGEKDTKYKLNKPVDGSQVEVTQEGSRSQELATLRQIVAELQKKKHVKN